MHQTDWFRENIRGTSMFHVLPSKNGFPTKEGTKKSGIYKPDIRSMAKFKNIYICISVYIYIYACITTYVFICIYIYTWLHMHVKLCIYICIYVYMYIYMITYACIALYLYIYIYNMISFSKLISMYIYIYVPCYRKKHRSTVSIRGSPTAYLDPSVQTRSSSLYSSLELKDGRMPLAVVESTITPQERILKSRGVDHSTRRLKHINKNVPARPIVDTIHQSHRHHFDR